MINLSKILNILGLKKTEKKIKNDETLKMLEKWNNRKIYSKLTTEDINSIPDEEIEQVIIDNIMSVIKNDFENEFKHIINLSKGQQAFFSTWILEGEISNGGFNQFYFNPSGKYAEMAVEGYKLFGTEKLSLLVRRANKIYSEIKSDLEKYNDGTLESFGESYRDNPLNELDDEFSDLYDIENINKLRVLYIRKNPNEFVTN